tara:strand:- start:33207 stop:35078 length:1872 start_codon:yes stop_codon:yes gene_type:complete
MRILNIFQQINQRPFFERRTGIILLVLLIPNIVLLAGSIQLFPPIGWVDPGIYTGYFWDLPGRIARFGSNYFSMRLPFTLVGYTINSILAPVPAAKFVALIFNTIAALSIFLLVSRRMSIAAGIATAWAFTLNPLWMATVSRTYVDGPAMAYALAALAVILAAKPQNDNRIRFGLGGALGAAAIYTHPIMILPLGAVVAADALLKQQNLKKFFNDLNWIASGAIILTILLGLVSLLLGGKFLFILSDPWAFTRTFKGFGENYRYELSSWVPTGFRLLPVAALFVFALIVLFLKRATQDLTFKFSVIGLAASGSIVIFLTILDYGIGGATLQSSFYSSYAMIGLVFLIAVAANRAFEGTEPQIGMLAICGGALALSIALAFSVAEQIWHWSDAHIGLLWVLLTASFSVAAFMLIHDLVLKPVSSAKGRSRQDAIRKAGFFLLAATIVICGIANKDTRRIFVTPSGINYESSFRSTVAVNTLVRTHLSPKERLFFWYDRDELTKVDKAYGDYAVYQLRFRDTYFYLNYWDSLTAIWLWDRSSLGWALPSIQAGELEKLTTFPVRSLIVTMCIDVSKCEGAPASLGEHKYMAKELTRQLIDTEGYTPFWAVIYEANPVTEDDPSPR